MLDTTDVPRVRLVLLFLSGSLVMGVLLTQIVTMGFALSYQGGTVAEIATKAQNTPLHQLLGPSGFYVSIVSNFLFIFLGPALLTAWYFQRHATSSFLGITKPKFPTDLLLGPLFLLVALPIVGWVFWINQQVPLPEWAHSMENNTEALLKALLANASPLGLVLNLLVMAVLPGICEEALFRGVVQRQLERRYPTLIAILLAAFIFSFFHFQFAGFLPRLVLGIMLGYLLHWSQSLWVPIAAHACYNGIQVFVAWKLGDQAEKMELENHDLFPWPLLVSSIFITGALAFYWIKRERITQG